MYRVPVGARHVDVELQTEGGVVVAKAELPTLVPALNPSESTGGAAASLTGPAKTQPVNGKREGTDFVFELQTCPGVVVRTSRGKVVAETVGGKHRVTLRFADAEIVRDHVVSSRSAIAPRR